LLGAPEIVPHGSFAAVVFLFPDQRSVCVTLPFVAASSSTPPKDEVVAEPFQATATTFVIKPP